MFKFLLYVFLFYVIFRFIFGVLFKGAIKGRVIHFGSHRHEATNESPEGSIKVQQKPTHGKQGKDNDLGEYVDYEEVK